jgi:predicted glycosyltransferase
MDYEHQPANHLAFRLASVIVLPAAVPLTAFRRQGAAPDKVLRYPGLKEELSIGHFEPNPAVLDELGLVPRPKIVVVVRTPPTRALYHPAANQLFEATLRTVCAQSDITCVALTRHPEQVAAIEALGLDNCVVPSAAIDSRSLLWSADAMVGAGGTMTREAALIGIPTWSLFAGKPAAVDLWLERQGLLRRLAEPRELAHLGPRSSDPRRPTELRERADAIRQILVDATLRVAAQRHGGAQPGDGSAGAHL